MCGYYSRAATIRGAATIRVNTVYEEMFLLFMHFCELFSIRKNKKELQKTLLYIMSIQHLTLNCALAKIKHQEIFGGIWQDFARNIHSHKFPRIQ